MWIIYQVCPLRSHRDATTPCRQSTSLPIFLPLTFPSLSDGTPAVTTEICLCPKLFFNSQRIMKKLKYCFLAQSLCIICVLTQFLGFFFFGSVQIVGFSYLLRLPGLRDCTGPHSSLPALGTAEGVLYTHTHNIHTSRFKGLKDWLV